MDVYRHIGKKQTMTKPTNSNQFTLGIIGILLTITGTILPLDAANTLNQSKYFPLVENTQYNSHIALSWQRIWSEIRRKKVAGGSRSDDLCLISPGLLIDLDSEANNIQEIWHQNPLFVWQSDNLKAVSLKDGDNIYWQQEVKATQTNLFYNGKPLQPGTTYKLVVFNPYETEIQSIQLVTPDKHQKIATDLANIEDKLKSESADKEEIALKKADYFAKLQMWSDVLWQLYSIPNPSDELKATLEELKTHDFCH